MQIEIERKFFIPASSIPGDHLANFEDVLYIKQGYISREKPTTRVRIETSKSNAWLTLKGKAWLTLKGKRDKVTGGKPEYEYEIPYQDGKELYEMCHTVVEKTRYILDLAKVMQMEAPHLLSSTELAGTKIEIDFFHGKLEGLVVAENERPESLSTESWNTLWLPSWFGIEVTNIKGWSNKALSKLDAVPKAPTKRKN